MNDVDALLIAGPTASGKSALAVEVARRCDGVVINADSMQVYRELRILSARPTGDEMAGVPHRLFGHRSGADDSSVATWLKDAEAALAEARARRWLPIFVGGTGLYFRALLDGLSPMPDVPDAVRKRWRERADAEGAAALHAILADRDAAMAETLRPTDAQRIVRALEVLEATGRSIASYQGAATGALVDPERTVRVFLDPDRAWLYPRIDARFSEMIAAGALDEVRALAALDLPADRPVMRAHGVPHLVRHLAGEMTLDDAAMRTRTDTRHYAKRQKTWFRHQMTGWTALGEIDPDTRKSAVLDLLNALQKPA